MRIHRLSWFQRVGWLSVLLGLWGCHGEPIERDAGTLGRPMADAASDSGAAVGDGTCADPEGRASRGLQIESWFQALTTDVPVTPMDTVLPEDTTGTLSLALHPSAFPVLEDDTGVRVAASVLGEGRVVAFSGQDFLSSQTRSTLLGVGATDTLLANAARWVAAERETPRVLVANAAVAEVLTTMGFSDVSVTPIRERDGLLEIRDWADAALESVDVAVVQVNEWGTLHVSADDVNALRNFVRGGGGLLIAGSAMHWSWWLDWTAPRFIGDLILEDSGIGWLANSERDLRGVRARFDASMLSYDLWCAYLADDSMTDAQLNRLSPLFASVQALGRSGELSAALERMIRETPALPVSSALGEARLAADVPMLLAPEAWPSMHPWVRTFPGLVESSAVESGSVEVDLGWSGFQPLGFYAPPGSAVTIGIGELPADASLQIQIGEPYDDLREVTDIETWRRPPSVMRRFTVDGASTQVMNVYGGAMYLVVPPGLNGRVQVEISSATPMAVYDEGVTSMDTWRQGLAAGAPWAILQERGHIRMVVSREGAAAVSDPSEVVRFWSGFHRSHAELAAEPEPRRYESHWIFDPQVGYGYANATSARITYPDLSEAWALRTRTGDEDWWLFGHELGHQFQSSDWTGGDITEVAVNLFTMYTLNDYVHGGGGFETIGFEPNTIDHVALRTSRWETADFFGKLQLYRQLIFEFGWEVFQRVFASYYSSDYPRDVYGDYMDGFAIRFSAITRRNLNGFFAQWEYPLSPAAVTQIDALGHAAWLPPGW